METPLLSSNIDDAEREVPERRVGRPDGAEIVVTVGKDGVHRYDLVMGGKVVDSEFERYPRVPRSPADFAALLSDAGFRVDAEVGRYGLQAPAPGDDTSVYICRRRQPMTTVISRRRCFAFPCLRAAPRTEVGDGPARPAGPGALVSRFQAKLRMVVTRGAP